MQFHEQKTDLRTRRKRVHNPLKAQTIFQSFTILDSFLLYSYFHKFFSCHISVL